MIKLEKLTPSVYYTKSRDFQFIGRLYDVVLNSIKTNGDLLNMLTDVEGLPVKWIDLASTSLGFQSKHNYSSKQLSVLCSIFHKILRNKGTLEAISMLGKALLSAEGLTDEFYCYLENNVLNVFLPATLKDLSLFNDLLNYIIPAGISCRINRASTKNYLSKTILKLDTSRLSILQKENAENTSALFRPSVDTMSIYEKNRRSIINSITLQKK